VLDIAQVEYNFDIINQTGEVKPEEDVCSIPEDAADGELSAD